MWGSPGFSYSLGEEAGKEKPSMCWSFQAWPAFSPSHSLRLGGFKHVFYPVKLLSLPT